MALAPKTRLGSYEILGLLGAGGMGEVYRAKDLRLGARSRSRCFLLKSPPPPTASPAWSARCWPPLRGSPSRSQARDPDESLRARSWRRWAL